MNQRPRCSVVIPVHNRAEQIGETLNSVWRQTFSDFEVIVVDDGSSDDLGGALARHRDPRLRVIHQENAGPASARNTGVDAARGELIAYLDSDDRWFDNHLADVIAELDRTMAPAAYAPMVVDRGVGRYAVRPSRPMRDGESYGQYRFVEAELLLLSTVVHRADLCDKVRWNEQLHYGDVDQYMLDLVNETGPIPMLEHATAVYNDITGPHKLSQASVYDRDDAKFTNYIEWLETQDSLSTEAVAAHRARNLSGLQDRAWDTARLLREAHGCGAISFTGALREFVRARRPTTYRYLIDSYVYMRGKPLQEIVAAPDIETHVPQHCEICAALTPEIEKQYS